MTATTVDLSEFEALSETHPSTCKVARLIGDLAPKDRPNFQAALAADHISALSIVKAFRARGLKVDDSTVARHRKGACCCV